MIASSPQNNQGKIRQRAQKKGHFGEQYAALYLRLLGYRILERRFKTHLGEVDIIAKRRNILVLIEVKLREHLNDAINAVTPSTQHRIEKAGGLFLSRHPEFTDLGMRYDIIVVSKWRLHHLKDAWRART